MLKRFMNWLLNRLQSLLGRLKGNGKPTSKNQAVNRLVSSRATEALQPLRSGDAFVRKNHLAKSAQLGERVDPLDADIAVAKRTSLVPSAERPFNSVPELDFPSSVVPELPAPASLDTSSLDTASLDTASLETASLDTSSLDIKNMPNALESESFDTHRRVNIASFALSAVDSIKPTFPTEVSELLGSPEKSDAEPVGTDLPVHSLKRVPDDQLPAIYDLLPAIESDVPQDSDLLRESGLALADNVLSRSESVEREVADFAVEKTVVDKSVSESSALESFQDPVFTQDAIFVQDAEAVLLPEMSSPDLEIASPDSSVTDPPKLFNELQPVAEQAVLFSFDIVESQVDSQIDSQIESDISSEDFSTAMVESVSVVAGTQEADALAVPLAPTNRENPVVDALTDAVMLESALPHYESKGFEAQEPKLPSDPPIADDQILASQLESPLATNVNSLPYPWSLPMQDEKLVKNGVVKLLFMLKTGNFHGYISPEDGTKDILFHEKYINAEIFSQLERGSRVAVSVQYLEGKAYATHVDLL